LEKQPGVIEAFPDTLPQQDESACVFVVLVASRRVNDQWSDEDADDDLLEEEDLAGAEYLGAGLILESVDDDPSRFRRVGALAFQGLGQDSWVAMLGSCCGQRDPSGEHDPRKGQKFWLE